MFWNTTRLLIAPERAPQVGEQLFGVHLPIFNFKFYFKTTSDLPNLLFPTVILIL